MKIEALIPKNHFLKDEFLNEKIDHSYKIVHSEKEFDLKKDKSI